MSTYSTFTSDRGKTTDMSYSKIGTFLVLALLIGLLITSRACSQGSIFGAVTNSDATTPDTGQILFIGYLDDTDEEIRLESSTGAGYHVGNDTGNWFDDFQNFLTEAPGNPYDYHFFNISNNEAAVLSKLIPNNSFQREDIQLGNMAFPVSPAAFSGAVMDDSTVNLDWQYIEGVTWHIYRRDAVSSGSFFRIDDPSGSLLNPGVSDSFYIDNTVDNISVYAYLIIPVEDDLFGVHSQIITIDSDPGMFICGDVNGNGAINILDGTYIINYLYKGGPPPVSFEVANMDGNTSLNILDFTYLINYLYKFGPELNCQPINM